MIHILNAEWQKTIQNKWLVGFTVWIFPTGIIGLALVVLFFTALSNDLTQFYMQNDLRWTTQLLLTWNNTLIFQVQIIFIAFAASVFAGEYRNHTWKTIVPRARRWQLITAKFMVVIFLLTATFIITSLLVALLARLASSFYGLDPGPSFAEAISNGLIQQYLAKMGISILSWGIVASYAAIATLTTRSVLGGTLAALAINALDIGIPVVLYLLYLLFGWAQVALSYLYIPSYNLQNLLSWVTVGTGFPISMPMGEDTIQTVSHSPAASILILSIWIAGAIGTAILIFRRQDIS